MTTPNTIDSAPTAPVRTVPPGSGGGLVAMGATALIERVRVVRQILDSVMVEGTHYHAFGTAKRKVKDPSTGVVSEVDVPNYSLGKAGAEMLCLTFGLTPDIDSKVITDDPNAPRTIQIKEWVDDPAARGGRRPVMKDVVVTGYYEVKSTCSIWSAAGSLLARASATCNSTEGAFRNTAYSDAKNPILKRSEKRALVAAVLMATGASDMFTQDLEDLTDQGSTGATGSAGSPMAGAPVPHGQAKSPNAWMSDAQKKLIFAKAKNQQSIPEKLVSDVASHIIHTLDALPRSQGKPYFDAIADGKASAVELWQQALVSVQRAASAPPEDPAGAPQG